MVKSSIAQMRQPTKGFQNIQRNLFYFANLIKDILKTELKKQTKTVSQKYLINTHKIINIELPAIDINSILEKIIEFTQRKRRKKPGLKPNKKGEIPKLFDPKLLKKKPTKVQPELYYRDIKLKSSYRLYFVDDESLFFLMIELFGYSVAFLLWGILTRKEIFSLIFEKYKTRLRKILPGFIWDFLLKKLEKKPENRKNLSIWEIFFDVFINELRLLDVFSILLLRNPNLLAYVADFLNLDHETYILLIIEISSLLRFVYDKFIWTENQPPNVFAFLFQMLLNSIKRLRFLL
jgi:hypothetical protein